MKSRFEGSHGRTRLIEALCDQYLIRGDRALAAAIAEVGTLEEYETGSILMRQGEIDNDLALILAGKVEIVVSGHVVATRMAGVQVGEMSAIDPKARRSATVRAAEPTIAARISEERLTAIAAQHPDVWRTMAKMLSGRLREVNKFRVPTNSRPQIFVGSSVETLPVARLVQQQLDHDPLDIVVWTESVFRPSGYALEDLLRQVHCSDFGLFVIGPDDMVTSRGSSQVAPRDNVVLELGLFMGALGRERVLVLQPRGATLKVPTDLLGINSIEYKAASDGDQASVGPACSEIRRAILRIGVRQRFISV